MNGRNPFLDCALQAAEHDRQRLSFALRAARICVFEVDMAHQLYTFFENAEAIFGVSDEQVLADVESFSRMSREEYRLASAQYFSHPDDAGTIARAFACIYAGNPVSYEARMRAGGSDYLWCKLDITPIMEGGLPAKVIGVVTDISAQREKNEGLQRAAYRDPATGLYNKTRAIEQIRHVLATSPDHIHALVLTDIDHFKSINDTYGHAVGDEVIKMVADRLFASFRKSDVIGRFGGDEFILCIRDIPSPQWLAERLEPLLKCRGEHISCTNSVGAAIFPQDSDDFDRLFEMADMALYRSKITRGTYTFYTGDLPPERHLQTE